MNIKAYNFTILISLFAHLVLAQSLILNEDAVRNSQIKLFSAINTPHLEFSPVMYGEGLVYVGNKEKGEIYDQEINESYFTLKYLRLNSESARMEDFSIALNSGDVHKGPCAFSQQERIIYYTKEKRFKDGRDAVLKILKAYKDENEWIPDGEFPFNSDNYSNQHPAMSPDGSFMIFASDREGGLGGFDLYISRYENGYWKEPENLGSAINSFGDEAFPYIHESGNIIFSSDGRGGQGQLDLFATRYEDDIWQLSENLGKPYNTKADDFGITIASDGKSGFFTSNRLDGEGKDDIYEFSALESLFGDGNYLIRKTDEHFQFSTIVLDKNSKNPIKDAEIYAIPIVSDGGNLILSNFDVSSIDVVSENENIVLTLAPKKDINGQFLRISDENGKSSFVMNRSNRYFIYVQKSDYASSQTAIDATNIVPEITLLLDKKEDPIEPPTPYVPNTYTIEQALDKRELVVFNEIYYDYNSANLKVGAIRELDLLSDYLIANPTLRVQLSSYTDARGRRDYNQNLSQDRAQSAKRYLVSKGVSDFRIIGIGRGENNIRNHCSNGVTCSDEEHEYNRRTEVEILEN